MADTKTEPKAPKEKVAKIPKDPNAPKVPKEPKIKEGGEKLVQVKESDLNRLLEQLDKQAKDIDLLYKASDKTLLSKALGTGNESLIKTVKISFWEDNKQLVVGWKLTKNVSEIVLGKWVEDQQVLVIFENGDQQTVSLLEFYRRCLKKKVGEIIKRSTETDNEGGSVLMLTVKFDDGKELKIDSTFVN